MTDTESWVDKYRPEKWSEVQGNTTAIKEIRQWATDFEPGDTPILLVGEPGTGKTTTANLVAQELDAPLNEINASSARKSDDLKQLASAMASSPVGSEYQVVFFDEVDSWHSSVDKTPIYDALEDPRNPVILAANEEWNVPAGIKNKAEQYEFKLGTRSVRAKLKKIAEAEGLEMPDKVLSQLCDRPDLRSAINDMQTWAESGELPGEDEREWEVNNFSVAESLAKQGDEWKEALSPRSKGMRPPWAAIWADETLRDRLRGLEAGVAFECLSLADRWLGRAGPQNDFRYWRYAGELLRELPDTRITEPYMGYINISFPSWVKTNRKDWDSNDADAVLYRALKGERGYGMSANYLEFRRLHLPILKDLSEEERMELILEHGVEEEGMEALDIDPSDFEDWVGEEVETGEWEPDTGSAADASW